MNGREKVNGHLLLTACLSRRCRGHQMRQLNAGHRELLQQSPGGLQGPKVWRGWESNWEIKSREVPGCWKGWEAPGAGGGCRMLAKSRQKSAPLPATVVCPALVWDNSDQAWLIPGAAAGLGAARCPLLVPGASLTPRARDAPRGWTSFLKHRQDLLSPQIHLRVSRRLGHNPPGGGLTNCRVSPGKSTRDTQGQLFTRHTSQQCSPMQDRIAGRGGGGIGEARPLLPPGPSAHGPS